MNETLILMVLAFAVTELCSCDNTKKTKATDFHCAQRIDVRR